MVFPFRRLTQKEGDILMAMELKTTGVNGFVKPAELTNMETLLNAVNDELLTGKGAGSDFLGWLDLPVNYDKEEFARIQKAAKKIQSDSDVLVVIGIGGSYLGARAAIEFCKGQMYNGVREKGIPEIYFVGNNISSSYINDVVKIIGDRAFSVNIISKSGTTTEPAVAFRFFREKLEKKYGKAEAAKRIYATTDAHKGALKALADQEGYEEFVVPDNIGGRYSVLTAVGLLPIAVAGVDLDELMGGAQEMMSLCSKNDYSNPAWQYAAMRHELYRQGKKVELLACFEPAFRFMAEWWKQLYGESEGKEEKGLFPASVDFTADLHSMGQYIQQGERMLMETVVRFAPAEQQMVVPFDEANGDGLNFLAGKTMDFINRQAMDGTLLAHVEGGVPNIILNLDENNARTMGQLIYFFEYACGLSGYLLGVNPFDQPGVEAYKKNMFALLGKPGYEEMGEQLRKRLR